jgi:hypothetical protein
VTFIVLVWGLVLWFILLSLRQSTLFYTHVFLLHHLVTPTPCSTTECSSFVFGLGEICLYLHVIIIKDMKVIEKDFVVGGAKLGTYNVYEDIEPELMRYRPGQRVLPAPFFYESGDSFTLIARHEPGTRFYPNGGFEVRDSGGGVRHYDLDQVIVHPATCKHQPTLDLMTRREEREAAAAERAVLRGDKVKVKVEGGRRGRPAIDPEVKAAREAEKVLRSQRSGGKRGRPASGITKPQTVKTTSGKRGRPALSTAQVTAKATARAATRAISGGRRGRPKSTR